MVLLKAALLLVPAKCALDFFGYDLAETCSSPREVGTAHAFRPEYARLGTKFGDALKTFDAPGYSMFARTDKGLFQKQYCVYMICRNCQGTSEIQTNANKLWRHAMANKCTKLELVSRSDRCACDLTLLEGTRCPKAETDSKRERKIDMENARKIWAERETNGMYYQPISNKHVKDMSFVKYEPYSRPAKAQKPVEKPPTALERVGKTYKSVLGKAMDRLPNFNYSQKPPSKP